MLYRFLKPIVKFLALIFAPWKAHNNDAFPQDGPVILCANHVSFTDPILLALALKRQLYFIAKKEICEAPFIGALVRGLGAFPVDREGKDLKAIRNCMNILKNSNVLGIFPEGTRIIHGKVSEAKAGVALIAKKAKAPIVMVHIKPKHGRYRLFSKTDLYFSDPISYEDLCGDLDYLSASQKIMESIYALGE